MEQEEICIDLDSGPLCELEPYELGVFTVYYGSKVYNIVGPPWIPPDWSSDWPGHWSEH